jgi:hypothetical protein
LLLKKKRINKLSCLNWVKEGQKIVIALQDAIRFKDKLIKLGFSAELKNGEKILPLVVNPATARNAEVFYKIDRIQPKETYCQPLWWTHNEWIGKGETQEVSEYVYIQRTRFKRINYLPYSIELTLKYNKNGTFFVVTDIIEFCKQNEKMLINTINIFLIYFGECNILTENLDNISPNKVIRLNWDILPQGDYPWEKIEKVLERVSKKSSKTSRRILIDNCRYINSFSPDFMALGRSGFSGYVIWGFSNQKRYILESIYTNNATYVFGKDWKELSKLSKAEILNENLQIARIIHNNNWKQNINQFIQG